MLMARKCFFEVQFCLNQKGKDVTLILTRVVATALIRGRGDSPCFQKNRSLIFIHPCPEVNGGAIVLDVGANGGPYRIKQFTLMSGCNRNAPVSISRVWRMPKLSITLWLMRQSPPRVNMRNC